MKKPILCRTGLGILNCLFSILIFEGVAERNSNSSGAAAAELKVVANQIKMHLRRNKNGTHGIVANPAAKVAEEMMAAGEICAAEAGAVKERLIETDALQADSRLQIRLGFLANRRGINCVEIVEQRTKRLKRSIHTLTRSPCNLSSSSKIFLEKKKIAFECQVCSASHILRSEIRASTGCRLSKKRADVESHIQLLGLGYTCNQEQHAKSRYEQGNFFQSYSPNPPLHGNEEQGP